MIQTHFHFQNIQAPEQSRLTDKIAQKLKTIDHLTTPLNYPTTIHIHVEKPNYTQYTITYLLTLPNTQMIKIKKTADTATKAIENSFNTLKQEVLEYLDQLKK
jgi:hypothetical protein